MKTKLLLFLCLILPLCACSQSRYLSTMPAGEDVTRLYIGPAMMKIAGSFDTGDETANQLMEEVKSIEIYNCENPKIISNAISAFDKIIKQYNAEELVVNEDDSEIARILMIPNADNPETGTLVIYNYEKNSELSIIILNGKIDMAKLATEISERR